MTKRAQRDDINRIIMVVVMYANIISTQLVSAASTADKICERDKTKTKLSFSKIFKFYLFFED